MTDDEARADARTGTGWINWDTERNCPMWSTSSDPTITLDGEFTVRELLAVPHFGPQVAD
ncbi:hypothetical protein CI15_33535 [Paraburkholderia monticola]|uniref:Uncharacterized protein n=1 Tax=Paraburkholderia monticola TaxID=1399968 RepID=A0A149PBP4_9BURK|nr:hypothetical protein CI15_33535 [Paraburkholderia monticola]